MKGSLLLAVFAFLALGGCKKKDDPVATVNPKVSITVENTAGSQDFALNTWYQNQNNDSFQVTEYKYYISNIRLLKENGDAVAEPESYHLIDQSKTESLSFSLGEMPAGEYTKLRLMIGVDEYRNSNGAQTGALDPLNGMFWDWNTGYIMAKLEGFSPQSNLGSNKIFYHIGGFQGKWSVIREVTVDLPSKLVLASGSNKNIHLKADILEWFKAPNLLKIADLPGSMTPGEPLSKIADNYADMFTVDHID
ncbi:MAG: hypothetical protein EOP49_05325 [Sphingobacteriales bacterium]|nr:MAG: hypothetical protein EOP49_05325 [Sphingobacteriales bacterium]